MEKSLYPIKFRPILKDKIWGGSKLRDVLNKNDASAKCGESWEISGVPGDISIVSNGWLADNSLEELIEIYMGDLVGEKVYDKFGTRFPLLIKFIDANDDLSIQVHPDDKMALERHGSYGKTEMWYVLQAERNSKLVIGFNKALTKEEYLQHLEKGSLKEILNYETIAPGDVYFMPAGRVHAIGAGILLAEIQQTSDITYRIYDYERKDEKGNFRELHTDLAPDAIDFEYHEKYKTEYLPEKEKTVEIVKCEYFTTNIIECTERLEKDYNLIDSFVLYICVDGQLKIEYNGGHETLTKGETILIPDDLSIVAIEPVKPSEILEVYIDL